MLSKLRKSDQINFNENRLHWRWANRLACILAKSKIPQGINHYYSGEKFV